MMKIAFCIKFCEDTSVDQLTVQSVITIDEAELLVCSMSSSFFLI